VLVYTALVLGIFNSGAGFLKIRIGNVLHVMNLKDQRNMSFIFILSLVCSEKLLLTCIVKVNSTSLLPVRIIYFLFL